MGVLNGKKKGGTTKAMKHEFMQDYLEENDIKIKGGTDVKDMRTENLSAYLHLQENAIKKPDLKNTQ